MITCPIDLCPGSWSEDMTYVQAMRCHEVPRRCGESSLGRVWDGIDRHGPQDLFVQDDLRASDSNHAALRRSDRSVQRTVSIRDDYKQSGGRRVLAV